MPHKDYFFLLTRLFLGYIFLSSGLCKLTHGDFAQIIGPPFLIKQLAEYDLQLFGYILAISQVLVGGLVITQRFSLVGLIALVPINFSILAVTISQGWTGTPYVNAFLLFLNVAALVYEYPTLKALILAEPSSPIAIPKSIALFKDIKGALGLLLVLTAAIGFSFNNNVVVTILGSFFFVGLGFYVLKATRYQLLQKLVLICFFLTLLLMTQTRNLNSIGIRGEIIYVAITAIGFLMWLISLFTKIRINKLS